MPPVPSTCSTLAHEVSLYYAPCFTPACLLACPPAVSMRRTSPCCSSSTTSLQQQLRYVAAPHRTCESITQRQGA